MKPYKKTDPNCPECGGYGGDWEFIENGRRGIPETRWVPCKRCNRKKRKGKRK